MKGVKTVSPADKDDVSRLLAQPEKVNESAAFARAANEQKADSAHVLMNGTGF
jgi:hypothetical protein